MKRGYVFSSNSIKKYWRCPNCLYVGRVTKSNIKDLFDDTNFLGKGEANG